MLMLFAHIDVHVLFTFFKKGVLSNCSTFIDLKLEDGAMLFHSKIYLFILSKFFSFL